MPPDRISHGYLSPELREIQEPGFPGRRSASLLSLACPGMPDREEEENAALRVPVPALEAER